MTAPFRSPWIAELRRRLRPGTLLTGEGDDAPSRVPPRRTVRDVRREQERKAAARQRREKARTPRHS